MPFSRSLIELNQVLSSAIRLSQRYLAKDFIKTADGIHWAVVINGLDDGRILCWPRYHHGDCGEWTKLSDAASLNQLAETDMYLFYSKRLDARIWGVREEQVVGHFQPEVVFRQRWLRTQSSFSNSRGSTDELIANVTKIFSPESFTIGLTGSRLIGAETGTSDLDLVIYGIEDFEVCRQFVAHQLQLSIDAPATIRSLDERSWREAYAKRETTTINYASYRRHEERKANKFLIGDTKVDISCVDQLPAVVLLPGEKLRTETIHGTVREDRWSFSTPAVYEVDHPEVRWIIVNTATYVGQAARGEIVTARGLLERLDGGAYRLVIGSDRQAHDHFLISETIAAV